MATDSKRICIVHKGGHEDRGGYCDLWATNPGHGPCILIPEDEQEIRCPHDCDRRGQLCEPDDCPHWQEGRCPGTFLDEEDEEAVRHFLSSDEN